LQHQSPSSLLERGRWTFFNNQNKTGSVTAPATRRGTNRDWIRCLIHHTRSAKGYRRGGERLLNRVFRARAGSSFGWLTGVACASGVYIAKNSPRNQRDQAEYQKSFHRFHHLSLFLPTASVARFLLSRYFSEWITNNNPLQKTLIRLTQKNQGVNHFFCFCSNWEGCSKVGTGKWVTH
jgi:hypothetical protein